MLRGVLGVVAGIFGGYTVVGGVEMLGMNLFPVTRNIDLSNAVELKTEMKDLPLVALATVVLAWALGALAGGWIGAKVAGHARTGLIVGFFVLLGTVMNMVDIPHPLWMWVCGVLLPLPLAWIGAKAATRAAPVEARS